MSLDRIESNADRNRLRDASHWRKPIFPPALTGIGGLNDQSDSAMEPRFGPRAAVAGFRLFPQGFRDNKLMGFILQGDPWRGGGVRPRPENWCSIPPIHGNHAMKYRVELFPSKEGFAVSVPGLPGCWSQGETEEEAMESIRDAIREYLAAVAASGN